MTFSRNDQLKVQYLMTQGFSLKNAMEAVGLAFDPDEAKPKSPKRLLSHPQMHNPQNVSSVKSQKQKRDEVELSEETDQKSQTFNEIDEPLQLGLLLSKQESKYGTNMFESLTPQDQLRAKYISEDEGCSRNAAKLRIFNEKFRHYNLFDKYETGGDKEITKATLSSVDSLKFPVLAPEALPESPLLTQQKSFVTPVPNVSKAKSVALPTKQPVRLHSFSQSSVHEESEVAVQPVVQPFILDQMASTQQPRVLTAVVQQQLTRQQCFKQVESHDLMVEPMNAAVAQSGVLSQQHQQLQRHKSSLELGNTAAPPAPQQQSTKPLPKIPKRRVSDIGSLRTLQGLFSKTSSTSGESKKESINVVSSTGSVQDMVRNYEQSSRMPPTNSSAAICSNGKGKNSYKLRSQSLSCLTIPSGISIADADEDALQLGLQLSLLHPQSLSPLLPTLNDIHALPTPLQGETQQRSCHPVISNSKSSSSNQYSNSRSSGEVLVHGNSSQYPHKLAYVRKFERVCDVVLKPTTLTPLTHQHGINDNKKNTHDSSLSVFDFAAVDHQQMHFKQYESVSTAGCDSEMKPPVYPKNKFTLAN